MKYIKDKWFAMVVWVIVLSFLPIMIKCLYVNYAPIDWIVNTHSVYAPDIKEGQTTQIITINATTYMEHDIRVVRELNMIDADTNIVVFKTSVVIHDTINSGITKVLYNLPATLEPGDYYWEIGMTDSLFCNTKRCRTEYSNVFKII